MLPENFKRIIELYSDLELDEFLLLLEITKEEFEKAEATGICDEELTRKLKIAEDPVKFFKFIHPIYVFQLNPLVLHILALLLLLC